jgi:tRNA-splicing ligase RtcB (3'-phosphate/5'-hydroxy nucleic acid ligase)
MKFQFLKRETPAVSKVQHPTVDIRLFATDAVAFEAEAFEQLFEFADIARAVEDLGQASPDFLGKDACIERIVLTPDFHKGSGIPVGTVVRARNLVLPQATGNDICCGMRLLTTDMPVELLDGHWDEIRKRLRAIFFEGKRDIPMSPRQREAVLRDGLPGLVESAEDNQTRGIWSRFDARTQRDDLERAHGHGRLPTTRLFGFENFVRSSGNVDGRDPQIGCVGGGNHFVEVQKVEAILDGVAARSWGISRGTMALMVHSGSVGIGHAVGGYFMDRARELFPTSVKAPKGGFYPLPIQGPLAHEGAFYFEGMGNAANFAFANRLFLGLMALRAIEEATGHKIESRLVYDAPHNLVFRDGEICLHRKGATPAGGSVAPDYLGQPVIIPGSMGSASYLLAGGGLTDALESACHGAGRSLSRGAASHVAEDVYHKHTDKLRIVTPVDPNSTMMRQRPDILKKYNKRIMEEAPYAYKPIDPVIDSVVEAGIARRVARLLPLCTVKG